MSELPDQLREMLANAKPAGLATIAKDGRPATVATWYLLEDDDADLREIDRPSTHHTGKPYPNRESPRVYPSRLEGLT